MNDELLRRSEAYLDGLFGPGAGGRHTRFLEHLDDEALREALHRCHVMEADVSVLSVEENYLLGLCVLAALRSYGPAAMFAKTLAHLGVPRAKILAAVSRLSMWVGPIQAAEAAAEIQRAIREFERHGLDSLKAWFPSAPEDKHG